MRGGRSERDLAEPLLDHRVEIRDRADLVDEAEAMRIGGRHAMRPQEERACRGDADAPDDVGRNRRRQDPDPRLGEADLRVVGGDDDVADSQQPGAATERRPMHARHHRHRQ